MAAPRLATWIACGLIAGSAAGADDNARRDAERRLEAVQAEIAELADALAGARDAQAREHRALRDLDLQLQQTALAARALEAERQRLATEQAALEAERAERLERLAANRSDLAEQVRAAWRLGSQSRLKLLMNQDDPARVSRMLAYYDYFSRAQAGQVAALRERLAELDDLQRRIEGNLAEAERAREAGDAERVRLEAQRDERRELLASLAQRIDGEAARLASLERDRRDLETLLERLENALADIPADLGARASLADRRGALPMPVAGPVLHAYGQARGSGLSWHGWMIGAAPGAEVNAIAYGRVAFADWLRGYGLLMVIDHGDGFMTLYGHNETLLMDVGDWVDAGEPIALAGVNPGDSQGIYFELRKDGKALDPASWLSRR